MTPLELLAKIASLVPPPRAPLIRFAGVLAPSSSWRASVVPASTKTAPAHACGPAAKAKAKAEDKAEDELEPHGSTNGSAAAHACRTTLEAKAALVHKTEPSGNAAANARATPEDKAERHDVAPKGHARTGLGSGVVPARSTGARIDWASLLKRGFREDVLACPCGGRRRVIADIQDRDVIVAILQHLGLPPLAPRVAPARDPTFGFW